MTYIEQIPTGQLSKYIDKFWYCEANNFSNATVTIPLLNHELVINFSETYCISRNAGLENIIKNLKSWISGIQTRPIISESVGKHEMIGVLFKPNGLKAFTKYDASEFENSFIDATLIFENSFSTLLEQIHNTKIVKSKFLLIEKYLIKNINTHLSPLYLNTSLIHFKLPTNKRISVRDTCSEIMISNKSLIKSYKKHVGVTPIKYLQLQSINKSLIHLSKDPKQSLTKLAYDLNYFDQAHFINSFKVTTGMTPGQYSYYVLDNKIDEGSPNFISF